MKNTFKPSLRFLALFFLIPLIGVTSKAYEFHFEKDSSLPLVYVNAAFRGGSTQDPDGKNGATDLMGKLMLRGTKNKTKQQLDLDLDRMGASLEFETRAEFIAFRGSVLSENLPQFLSLLGEILTAPSFRAQELDKLKKEQSSQLLDELSQDRTLARLRFEETFFKGHPYSKQNTGRVKDIQSLSIADIQKQYQKLITEDHFILLGSGDTQSSSFDTFLADVKQKRNIQSTLTLLPDFNGAPDKLRVVIFDKPDRTQTQVVIGQKGISIHDPKVDALSLANHAFGGGGFQARLMIELRVKRGWTYGAGSAAKMGSKPHSWKMSFFPKNADTPPAIKESLNLVRDLKEKGITEAEFNASKKSLYNSSGFSFNTPAKRMENTLTESIFGLPSGYHREYGNRLNRLTLDEVNKAVAEFFTPEKMMVGLVATASISKAQIAKALGIPESSIEVQDYQKE